MHDGNIMLNVLAANTGFSRRKLKMLQAVKLLLPTFCGITVREKEHELMR